MFFVITPPMCTIIKALILTLTPHWPITHAASKKCCRYLKRTVVKKLLLAARFLNKAKVREKTRRPTGLLSLWRIQGLDRRCFSLYAQDANMSLGKFVIPNPFGPFEELRFTAYLIRCCVTAKAATVNTPDYVRDNIHVSLLAKAYAAFVAGLPSQAGFSAHHPSGYVETQGGFARRFAAEMEKNDWPFLSCGIKKTNRF